MTKSNNIKKSINFVLLFLLALLIWSCAAMQTPQGGPRDTTAPKVLKTEPKNLSTNFKAKKIVVEFDEYVKLQNQYKEFNISPELDKMPILKLKGRNLEISIEDTLEKNTTYTMNFGKAIADVNESNVLKNFSYVFSTGPTLDSLSISGKVVNAVSLKPEIEQLVFIIPKSRDTIFGKRRPAIYTFTDSSGNFKLSNLRKDTYRIYALKEQNGDKIYQQNSDKIGFLKDTLSLTKNIDSVFMTVFEETPALLKVLDKKIDKDGSIQINLNKKLVKPELSILEPADYDGNKIFKSNKTNDSLKIWVPKMDFDSLKIALKDGGKVLEQIKVSRGKRDTYTTDIKAGDNIEGNTLNPTKPLKLYFNYPINNIDLSKIQLLEDSIPRTGFKITKDSLDILTYNVSYDWKDKEEYILQLKDNAVTGILGNKNKDIRKTFKLGSRSDYRTITLNITVPDSSINYIVEILNEKKDGVIASQQLNSSKKLFFSNYKSGIYFLRIVYDENKNGIWDTGDLKLKIQPEKYWYSPTEMSVRAGWDREDKLSIPPISEAYKQLPVEVKPKPQPQGNQLQNSPTNLPNASSPVRQ